jgi:hypothetical protein
MRTSYLKSYLPICHSVCPGALRSRKQSFYWLLRKHHLSIPLFLMASLALFTVNCYIQPACAGVSHWWRVTTHNTMSNGLRIGKEQMFPTRLVQKPSFVLNLLPTRPSFGSQDNFALQYVSGTVPRSTCTLTPVLPGYDDPWCQPSEQSDLKQRCPTVTCWLGAFPVVLLANSLTL